MNRICFGMPTLLECPSIEDSAALCQELRLDFIELNQNLPAYQPDSINLLRIRDVLEQHSLFATLHLDENLNPFDFNGYAARAYQETAQAAVRAARKLGCPVITMHLPRGVYFTLPDRKAYLNEIYRDEYLARVRGFRDRMEQAIGDSEVTLCIENTSGWSASIGEAAALLLESPVFGLTFDTGHDLCAGGQDRNFILSQTSRLRHIHLHDSDGSADHLPLGTGKLDIRRILSEARAFRCRCVLEVKTVSGLRESVDFLRKPGLFGEKSYPAD